MAALGNDMVLGPVVDRFMTGALALFKAMYTATVEHCQGNTQHANLLWLQSCDKICDTLSAAMFAQQLLLLQQHDSKANDLRELVAMTYCTYVRMRYGTDIATSRPNHVSMTMADLDVIYRLFLQFFCASDAIKSRLGIEPGSLPSSELRQAACVALSEALNKASADRVRVQAVSSTASAPPRPASPVPTAPAAPSQTSYMSRGGARSAVSAVSRSAPSKLPSVPPVPPFVPPSKTGSVPPQPPPNGVKPNDSASQVTSLGSKYQVHRLQQQALQEHQNQMQARVVAVPVLTRLHHDDAGHGDASDDSDDDRRTH